MFRISLGCCLFGSHLLRVCLNTRRLYINTGLLHTRYTLVCCATNREHAMLIQTFWDGLWGYEGNSTSQITTLSCRLVTITCGHIPHRLLMSLHLPTPIHILIQSGLLFGWNLRFWRATCRSNARRTMLRQILFRIGLRRELVILVVGCWNSTPPLILAHDILDWVRIKVAASPLLARLIDRVWLGDASSSSLAASRMRNK